MICKYIGNCLQERKACYCKYGGEIEHAEMEVTGSEQFQIRVYNDGKIICDAAFPGIGIDPAQEDSYPDQKGIKRDEL